MKALDTPVLLAILEGRPEGRGVLRDLAVGEVCTTELNLFELEAMARADSKAARTHRLAAIERLRRKISILAFDERASRIAARLAADHKGATSSLGWLILGILVANGANELLTTESARYVVGSSPVRIRLVTKSRPQAQ
ncbi:MAG: PIN domain-containing protein [Thermoplasmata archaeon]|nr:PIN domain-containing protein [Thermoplasmata archaeon]